MTFNDNAQLDTSQVESGGSGGGGMAPGGVAVGGVGGLILMIIMVLLNGLGGGGGGGTGGGGASPWDMNTSNISGSNSSVDESISQCKTGADANRDDTCRVVGTVNSVQAFWTDYMKKAGRTYEPAKTVLYSGATQTACGTGSSAMGPFYCPLDKKVYIDVSFFKELSTKYGADGGPLAQEYVVAHEYGHHVQNLLGVLGRAQQDPQGRNSGAVRVELMADCFGGMWVHHATTTKDANGTTLMQPITEADIKSGLSAAAAVGDDRIQEKAQGRVTPENWTHGSAAARQKWFTTGYQDGDINKCDTFAVQSVE
ncbi:neutral zinc metallopeptidase [Yimella sp. cx-51]|uniref:KPN_02809 family neutral zinc metallopeptidase n=1 Tax=Yimella sp. cx-51 TaxID=2770551 RepID=UPI00165DDD5B|nr:neutral zinc metallopeptidase [Yimella sp. cx-51]MBC9957407.1 neutral zinc metallopeptidase [Yimella sp. cx-51]MBD2760298.1 neutral zinc metallopeptidase [Yimella sp. cx-573]QTH39353.1 neutral zinc metallopeptidase [Yimella sp. cx-51]